jgi:divalent metal cation (Fe/Co/Zn/Cd) transporter
VARLYRLATQLALFTIGYNIIEGIVSVWLGISDDTLSLLGFGVDSFVEVISGLGVLHMLRRVAQHGNEVRDQFERRALRITGTAFYLLATGLVITAIMNLLTGHAPVTTIWGVIIASISIVSMWLLVHYKFKVGTALNSDAILSDAKCSLACLHFSLVLLAASLLYEFTGIGYLDSIGAIGIAALAMREGRDAFMLARGQSCCSCSSDRCQ